MVESLLIINIIALWLCVIVIFILLLRVMAKLKMMSQAFEPPTGLPVGEKAAPFSARTFDGTEVSLAQFKGRSLALFFVRPGCDSCHQVITLLQKELPATKETMVQVLFVIDADPAESHDLIHELNDDGVLLFAPTPEYNLIQDYNPSRVTPFACFVDEQGVVQMSGIPMGEHWLRLRHLLTGVAVRYT